MKENGIVYHHAGGMSDVSNRGPIVAVENSRVIIQIGSSKYPTDVEVTDGLPHQIVLKYGYANGGMSSLSVDNGSEISFQLSDDLMSGISYRDLFFSIAEELSSSGLNLGSFKGCISDVRLISKATTNADSSLKYYSLRFDESAPEVSGFTSRSFTKLECIRAQCESDNVCGSDPCQNSGVCQPSWNEYTCDCQTGWAGINCEETNFCDGNPCEDSENCVNGVFGFECHDPISFKDGFVQVKPEEANTLQELESIYLELRTRKEFGTVFHMQGESSSCFINMQISNDKTLLNFRFGESATVTNAEIEQNLADGRTNMINIVVGDDGTVSLQVNNSQISATTPEAASRPTVECIAGDSIWIGGFSSENASLTNEQSTNVVNPQPAIDGCISNFRINNLFVPLQPNFGSNLNFTFVASENVEFGCSSDACSTNASVCENGGTCVDEWRAFSCDCVAGELIERCSITSKTKNQLVKRTKRTIPPPPQKKRLRGQNKLI